MRRRDVLRGAARDDSGQVMLLTLGFVVVAIALITVVAAAADLHLERKRLLALADVVALEAADAIDDHAYYGGTGDDPVLTLTDETVRDAVEEYLAGHREAAETWRALAVTDASSPDGASAHVELTAAVRPAVVGWITDAWTEGVTITVSSNARAS